MKLSEYDQLRNMLDRVGVEFEEFEESEYSDDIAIEVASGEYEGDTMLFTFWPDGALKEVE